MNPVYEKLEKCYNCMKDRIPFTPKVALVLGSGLGDFADSLTIEGEIDYHAIDGFPVSTVAGHKGRFVFAHVAGVPVVIMQGRVHYYEGYDMTDVVLPTRLMKRMGAEILFLTNAAGGLRYEFASGALMIIRDHISSMVPSPLRGENIDELGVRFPDMSRIYDEDLRDKIKEAAEELGQTVYEGVYMQFPGPAYESPSEVKLARVLGADAVGMSTACEALAANHMGMKICGISCITNLGCGMTDKPLCHTEVQEVADRISGDFKKLVTKSIEKLGELQ